MGPRADAWMITTPSPPASVSKASAMARPSRWRGSTASSLGARCGQIESRRHQAGLGGIGAEADGEVRRHAILAHEPKERGHPVGAEARVAFAAFGLERFPCGTAHQDRRHHRQPGLIDRPYPARLARAAGVAPPTDRQVRWPARRRTFRERGSPRQSLEDACVLLCLPARARQPALTCRDDESICMAMDKPRLEITLCAPRGFCAGVDRAIQIVELALEKYGAPVYVRHAIVHTSTWSRD